MNNDKEIMRLLASVKKLAQRYRVLTGKPLGITGEIAEFEAAKLLRIKLTPARTAGYDAIRKRNGRIHRLQIKGRCVLPGANSGQRMGAINVEGEFDGVLLVLMDESFNATAIYEADRSDVVAALIAPGSVARNERGALGVQKFKSIGRCVWSLETTSKSGRSPCAAR
jgi:hypothetical protein